MLSIFATPAEASAWSAQVNVGRAKHDRVGVPRRPLKTKTLQRIARGLVKWVIQAKRPYIVRIAHGETSAGGKRWGDSSHSIDTPLGTVAASKDFAAVDVAIAPYSVPRYGEREGQEPRSASVDAPAPTIVGTGNQASLVAALLTKHYGGNEGPGSSAAAPFDTITAKDHNALTVAHLLKFRGESPGTAADAPVDTITAGSNGGRPAGAGHAMGLSCATLAPYTVGAGGPAYSAKPKSIDEPFGTVMVEDRRAIIAAFLDTYYGNSKDGGSVDEPSPTVVSKDRISLVTVAIDGQTYVVTDIAMRMLTPKELLLAQGFPADYRVDITADGTRVSKADQVKLIGNAVPPPFARALAFANVVEQGVLGKAVRK